MVDLRKCEDEKSKQHWAFVEATSNIVRRWPRWKVAAAGTWYSAAHKSSGTYGGRTSAEALLKIGQDLRRKQ